mmetsp:Transcript_3136/g.6489  ORF Transcript_3136/g.6489 Transcript_3136/m.6489 type:complete len:473 (-) Transcript_3136:12-1430(-)
MESEIESIQRLLCEALEKRIGPLEESLKLHRTLISALSNHIEELKEKKSAATPRRAPSLGPGSRTPRSMTPRKSLETPPRPSTSTNGDRKKQLEDQKRKAEEEAQLKRERALQKATEERLKKEALLKKKEEEAAKKAEERKQKEAADKEAKRIAAEEKKKREEEKKQKEEERKKKEAADKEAKRIAAEEKKKKDEERKHKELEDKRLREETKKQAQEDKKRKDHPDKLKPEERKKKHPSSRPDSHKPSAEQSEESMEEAKAEPVEAEVPQVNPVFVIEDEEEVKAPTIDKDFLLSEIESELAQLTASYDESALKQTPAFELTIGSRSALSLLRDMTNEKLYLSSTPTTDVVWAFRLFHQFRGVTLPQDEVEAWAYCQNYLTKNRNELDKLIQRSINEEFKYTNDNIDILEELVTGREASISPQNYTSFCQLTGLLMFAIKEACEYSGLIKEKAAPWRRYSRLLHKQRKLSSS